MSDDAWTKLRQAYERGEYTEVGKDKARHLVFEDGTLWFQEPPKGWKGAEVGIPIFSVCAVAGLVATMIGVHDGLAWWPAALGVSALFGAVAVYLYSVYLKRIAALRAELELGLIFRAEELVICNTPRRTIPRSSIAHFKRRSHSYEHDSGASYFHVVLKSGEELVTEIRECNQTVAALQGWLTGTKVETIFPF